MLSSLTNWVMDSPLLSTTSNLGMLFFFDPKAHHRISLYPELSMKRRFWPFTSQKVDLS